MNLKLPLALDTSFWEIIPDFNLVRPRPLYVSTKATEGVAITDSKFLTYFRDLGQDGIRRGCYHFFRKAYDPVKQAIHYCDVIRPLVTDLDVLELDFEEGGETAMQLIAFLDVVESVFPRNLIMLYSRKDLMDAMPMSAAQSARLRNYKVWVAGYPYEPDMYASVPSYYIPDKNKWGAVWMWQYSDHAQVEGIQGNVDANWLAPEFIQWLGGGDPGPDTEGGSMSYEATALADATRLRSDHNTNSSIYAQYPRGTKFNGSEIWVASADIYGLVNGVNTLLNARGDKWLKVADVAAMPAPDPAWVAIIHKGQPICSLVEVNPPAPTIVKTHTVDVYSDGSLIIDGKPYS